MNDNHLDAGYIDSEILEIDDDNYLYIVKKLQSLNKDMLNAKKTNNRCYREDAEEVERLLDFSNAALFEFSEQESLIKKYGRRFYRANREQILSFYDFIMEFTLKYIYLDKKYGNVEKKAIIACVADDVCDLFDTFDNILYSNAPEKLKRKARLVNSFNVLYE